MRKAHTSKNTIKLLKISRQFCDKPLWPPRKNRKGTFVQIHPENREKARGKFDEKKNIQNGESAQEFPAAQCPDAIRLAIVNLTRRNKWTMAAMSVYSVYNLTPSRLLGSPSAGNARNFAKNFCRSPRLDRMLDQEFFILRKLRRNPMERTRLMEVSARYR